MRVVTRAALVGTVSQLNACQERVLKTLTAGEAILCIFTLMFCAQLGTARLAAKTTEILKADSSEGKLVFAQKCEPCHFDLSSKKKIVPGLAGLMKRERFTNGMTADESHLRRVIDRGGKDMPSFRGALTEKQIRDLIAYVKTL